MTPKTSLKPTPVMRRGLTEGSGFICVSVRRGSLLRTMSTPNIIAGFFFLVLGLLMALFARPLGVVFCRIGKAIWKGHEDDVFGKLSRDLDKAIPFLSREKIYHEAGAPKVFQFLGAVFMIQGVVFFVLAEVT